MMKHLTNSSKYHQSYFIPKNPQKYKGEMPIRCLSSWELKVCQTFDNNPNILQWVSEPLGIPYLHPFKPPGRNASKYYPDYMVIYVDRMGVQHSEIVEVKPSNETFMESAKSKKNKAAFILNQAKWTAARQFAKYNGMTFRVITEKDIFSGKR